MRITASCTRLSSTIFRRSIVHVHGTFVYTERMQYITESTGKIECLTNAHLSPHPINSSVFGYKKLASRWRAVIARLTLCWQTECSVSNEPQQRRGDELEMSWERWGEGNTSYSITSQLSMITDILGVRELSVDATGGRSVVTYEVKEFCHEGRTGVEENPQASVESNYKLILASLRRKVRLRRKVHNKQYQTPSVG